ncbi:antibiotic biosynthesis monooxygenase [bacterium SCSIO 12741]|nr:antibiotic biosynthesis monooxygenase [bacterium SCSIO 12741]
MKNDAQSNSNQPAVFEISYLRVKEGSEKAFRLGWTHVSREMEKAAGIRYMGLFESFYSFPQKKARNAFVQISQWDSMEAMVQAQSHHKLKDSGEFANTYVVEEQYQMKAAGDLPVHFREMIGSEYAIEFAARTIKPSKRSVYPKLRNDFMKFIKDQPGYAFDQEFEALAQDVDVLIFGWKTVEDFQNAGKRVKRSIKQLFKTVRYFQLIKHRGFQVGTCVEFVAR